MPDSISSPDFGLTQDDDDILVLDDDLDSFATLSSANAEKRDSTCSSEDTQSGAAENPLPRWKILVVDDEEQVHSVTRLALKNFEFEDRPLEIISAYSKSEAQKIIDVNPDTAVLLLDVVMESDRAGLELVEYIRGSLKNLFVRIILRTGQPGAAPENAVIEGFDINDYKAKTELTQQKLVSTMITAIRSYRDILNLEEDRCAAATLNEELEAFNQSLEAVVRQRTEELQEKNYQLELEIQARIEIQKALELSNQELEIANQKLAQLANHDGLTGLANRRCFDEHIDRLWKQALREQSSISLILCDIDFFKQYNDTYGHVVGDRCLQQVAETLQQVLDRPLDLAARFGGEEFAIILFDADVDGSHLVAEKIRTSIQKLNIPHQASSVSASVTISAGVAATIPHADRMSASLVTAADEALYAAKQQGRNRTIVQPNVKKSSPD